VLHGPNKWSESGQEKQGRHPEVRQAGMETEGWRQDKVQTTGRWQGYNLEGVNSSFLSRQKLICFANQQNQEVTVHGEEASPNLT